MKKFKKVMKKIIKKIRGFTLVELMVAVAIGIVVVSIGVVSVNNFYSKQKVDGVATEVAGMVRLAKNYAVTMQSPGGYAQPVEYVVVTINSTGLVAISPGNNSAGMSVGTTYTSKQVNLGEVQISQVANGVLMFSMPEGKLLEYTDATQRMTRPRPATDSVNILVVSQEDSTKKNGVLINATGVIEERANVLQQVPTNAMANEGTLTTKTFTTPTATPIPPTPTNSLVATSTPSPTPTIVIAQCSSCGYFDSASQACLNKCGSPCGVAGCNSVAKSCGGTVCYDTVPTSTPTPIATATPTSIPSTPTPASQSFCTCTGICLGCCVRDAATNTCRCEFPCKTSY